MVEDVDAALRDAVEAKARGADLVEFRVDTLFQGGGGGGGASEAAPELFDEFGAAQCERLCAESALPCIVTCRSAAEAGGAGGYDGDEASRVALYERLGTLPPSRHPPRYLDFELAAYERSANLKQKVNLAVDFPARSRELAPGLILSAHDFNGRPANLARTVAAMNAEPAPRVNKLAFRARSLRDNLELFELLRTAQRPTIALGMGEFGLMSRVLAPKFGGFLTFAALRDASATAPGQPTLDDLLHRYRFRSIGRATKVYGVIGWPVAHSLSPTVHNAGFERSRHDGVYLPLPVPAEWEHFKATLGALLDDAHLEFRGASVTLPHKEHLLRFAREQREKGQRWDIDQTSARCGAANTLVVRADGSCAVMNTDAPAAVASLESLTGPVRGRRVAVLGAGGVGRAVACGLVDAGATVVVYNRDRARAARLVTDLSAQGPLQGKLVVGPWDKLDGACCEAFVNCTPVGMKGGPAPDDVPFPTGGTGEFGARCGLGPEGPAFMDTVYAPMDTPMIRFARQRGLRFIGGADMFVRQAVMQLEAWLGAASPGGPGNAHSDDGKSGTSGPVSTHDLYKELVLKALASPAP